MSADPSGRMLRGSESAIAWLIPVLLITELALVVFAPSASEYDPDVTMSMVSISGPVLWTGRLQTLALILIGLASLPSRWRDARARFGPVAMGFIALWICATLLPALGSSFGPRPHAYLYPLILGLAYATASPRGFDEIVKVASWSIFIPTLISLIVFAIKPAWVADVGYDSGLIASFPRLSGFTMQANLLGAILVPWLLMIRWRPFPNRWIQRIAFATGLIALAASQSKTSIAAFVLGWFALMLMSSSSRTRGALLGGMLVAGLLGAGLILLAAASNLLPHLSSENVALLTSGTGRDLIWSVALDAWRDHPILGYGPQLFRDGAFDSYPALRWTPHAHNQIFDTLGRSGIVGLSALVLLLGIIAFSLSRLSPDRRAFGLALLLALLVQCATETPISVTQTTLLGVNFWLLMSLAASSGPPDAVERPAPRNADIRRPAPRGNPRRRTELELER